MLPALNIPAPVSPPCPIPLPPCRLPTALRAFSPWDLLKNSFPFPIPIPVPHPLPFLRCLHIPLHVLSRHLFPYPIIDSLPIPGSFLTALRVLLILAVIIVIPITRTARSTARHPGIRPVLINIILVDHPIPIQRSNGQEVPRLVLPAAWRLNLCPGIIPPMTRGMLAVGFNLPWAGCLQTRAIHMIPEGMGVVPSPIFHLDQGCVKHLRHLWVEGSPPLPKRRTPAPAVWPHQLDFWKVVSCDWIKIDYIIKEVPCPIILDAANIVYPYEYTNVFWDESLYMVGIPQQASIYSRCRHLCSSLPHYFEAARWYHCCELKMNLHPKRWHYNTVTCSGRKPRGKLQICVCYWVCFGMRVIVLCKSCDVKISQDAGGVYNMGGKENGGVGGKKGYIYSSSDDLLVQLVRQDTFHSYPAFGWLTNTKRPSHYLAQPPGTTWTTNVETRFSTRSEDNLRRQTFLLHRTLLTPCSSRSKLSRSQVASTVERSNTATNTPSGGNSMHNWCYRMENTSLSALRWFQLYQRGNSTGKLEIYTTDDSKYCAKTECNTTIVAPRQHKHLSSGANRPSDVAETGNINA